MDDRLRQQLESIKESIVGFKYMVDNAQDRLDKLERELLNSQSTIHDLKANVVRTDERIATIQKYLDGISGDIRSVRNSIVAAIIGALIIGTTGVALSTFHRQTSVSRSEIADLIPPDLSLGRNVA